jgi:hypothetical protein
MDDLPEKESPRVWIAAGIFLAAITLAFFMLVYTHVRAEAQERQVCGPAEILLRQFSEIHKERPVWEGTVHSETGPVEVILLQGDKNTWTLFAIQGATACILASGKDATPIADKGV